MSNSNRAVRTHTNFIEIKIHTAKCDTCNKHNTSTMFRCADCGQQCCTACWTRKGGDGTHVLNAGDKGWTPERAQVLSMSRSQRKKSKVNENRVTKRRTTERKSRYVINDDDDDEEELGTENDETVQEGEGVEKQTRRSARSAEKPEAADDEENPMALEGTEGHTGPSNPRPTTKSTSTQTDPSILVAADKLLLNAIDPTSPTADGFSMILKAAAHIDSPQGPSQATTASAFRGPASESSSLQDAQAQTPLFVEEDLDLESEPISQSKQGKNSCRVSWADEKGKDRKVQDDTSHQEDGTNKDERSTLWE